MDKKINAEFYFGMVSNQVSPPVHKFGRNAAVGTTFVPVAIGGVYQMPQAGSATALRVKAGNAADAAAGAGGRSIFLQGIDATGAEVTESVPTAGIAAGADSTNAFMRLYRAYVDASGTYATTLVGSHTANIVIENAAGSADWLTIDATGYSRGQSEVAWYCVPAGKVAYITSAQIRTDSSKKTDLLFLARTGALQTAAPYDAMRLKLELGGITTSDSFGPKTPLGPYPAGTDLGWLAKVNTGTGEVDVDFEIVLLDAKT